MSLKNGAWLTLVVALSMVAGPGCSSGGSVPAEPASSGPTLAGSTATATATETVSPPSVGPTGTFWFAVFHVAEDPDGLDEQTRALAPVLGGALMAAPSVCFTGLPASAGSGYVLGAVARDRATLDGLVVATGATPRFVVRTRSACAD